MEANIPAWVQQVTLFGVMIASTIIGLWRYFKTESDKVVHKPATEVVGHVTAASFVDSKILKELIDTLREHQEEMGRQSQRVTRSQTELRESLIELNENIHLNTNSVTNMLRFMKRE